MMMSNGRQVFLYNQRNELKYTWRQEWISPYESTWSTFEKFRFMNHISNKDLLKHFGNDYVKKLKKGIGDTHKNLYRLNGLNHDMINNIICRNFINQNKSYIKSLSKSNDTYIKYFRSYLWYCPICISEGYHSLFHQFMFIHQCPFHNIPLLFHCPKCKNVLDFMLDDRKNRHAFHCSCGNNFLQEKGETLNWRRYDLNIIKQKDLLVWLNQKEFDFNNIYFSDSSKEDNHEIYFKHEIKDILEIQKRTYFSSRNLSITKSHHNINNIRSILQFKEKVFHKRKLLYHRLNGWDTDYLETIDDELKDMSDKVFSTIARYIRKRLIKNHIPCLKHLTRNFKELSKDKICPYAYAYALWRKHAQSFRSIADVDNFGYTPFYRESRDYYYFPTLNDYHFLDDIITCWKSEVRRKLLKPFEENREGLKWIVSKILERIIVYDFIICLEIAKKHLIDNLDFNFRDFLKPVLVPQLIINTSKNEIHIKSLDQRGLLETIKKMNCPNDSVKKRKGPKTTYCKPNPIDILDR